MLTKHYNSPLRLVCCMDRIPSSAPSPQRKIDLFSKNETMPPQDYSCPEVECNFNTDFSSELSRVFNTVCLLFYSPHMRDHTLDGLIWSNKISRCSLGTDSSSVRMATMMSSMKLRTLLLWSSLEWGNNNLQFHELYIEVLAIIKGTSCCSLLSLSC